HEHSILTFFSHRPARRAAGPALGVLDTARTGAATDFPATGKRLDPDRKPTVTEGTAHPHTAGQPHSFQPAHRRGAAWQRDQRLPGRALERRSARAVA